MADCMTHRPIASIWEAMRRPITTPTLVLWGADDASLGTVLLRDLEQLAPASQVHVLERCSHWVQQDKAQEVTELMRAFLKDTAAAAAMREAGEAAAEPAGSGP